jgi:hypothetical protein
MPDADNVKQCAAETCFALRKIEGPGNLAHRLALDVAAPDRFAFLMICELLRLASLVFAACGNK